MVEFEESEMENMYFPKNKRFKRRVCKSYCSLVVLFLLVGCAMFDPKPSGVPIINDQAKEGAKMSLPDYYIETPDIISIEAVHLVPKSPYILRTYDIIHLDVTGTPDDEPLTNTYVVQPGGNIQLGATFGSVRVGGLSIDDAEKAVLNILKRRLKNPSVSAQLHTMSEVAQIVGNKMVAPDGYITIGSYGLVYVNGLTVPECREAIELHLSEQLEHPMVAVEVFAYNSKSYYVILQGGSMGEQVYKFPYTGNETVLDAIAAVNGLAQFSSKRIWVARPIGNTNHPLILPVDWNAVAAYAAPQTNYQIIPGDRVFVQLDNWVAFDQRLARIFAPFERIMGFMLLGATTVSRYSGDVLGGGGEKNNYR